MQITVFKISIYISMIVFLFSKSCPFHWLNYLGLWTMIDESTSYHSRLRTTAMFFRVLIWYLKAKLKTPRVPSGFFVRLLLKQLGTESQGYHWYGSLSLCFLFQSFRAKYSVPTPGMILNIIVKLRFISQLLLTLVRLVERTLQTRGQTGGQVTVKWRSGGHSSGQVDSQVKIKISNIFRQELDII